jgi:hypothetical protein
MLAALLYGLVVSRHGWEKNTQCTGGKQADSSVVK